MYCFCRSLTFLLLYSQFDIEGSPNDVSKAVKFAPIMNAVDASTQTEYSLVSSILFIAILRKQPPSVLNQ